MRWSGVLLKKLNQSDCSPLNGQSFNETLRRDTMSKYDDLVKKLKEIFQIDRPELDFGVYRILNCRIGEINDYLDKRLKDKVDESLAAFGAANVEGLQKELNEKETQYRADGIDPDTVPKVQELKKKLAEYGVGTSEHKNGVFTHLLTFFSRYYDKGDFISQRRYKGDTYAIPYAGEEVMLHWANKDQYYTKSGESFSNFAFKLEDGRTVRFRLITADTAKDNRKDKDTERRFVLINQHIRTLTDDEGDEYEEELLPVEEENGELVLRFEYKVMAKGCKQDTLVLDAVNQVLNDPTVKTRWLDLSKREPTEMNPQRTLLEKCLTNYTTKNTADYFIHKDLGRFLRGELDFYIKSEVMHLDDVQNAEKFADIEKNLRMIQTLRAIAIDLITFLAQLEDFQKKLWLKKKFVVSSHYCVTLDRVPESLYPNIATNPKQWEQWENLGMLEATKNNLFKQAKAGSIAYLKEHPSLMVDTAIFNADFKFALLAAVDNLDESLDGLLINGDNFQSLNLLLEKYKSKVRSIYIDPPYNTSASEILYKNNYKHSSWLSLLHSRVIVAKNLLQNDGFAAFAIDDFEGNKLQGVLDDIFGFENRVGNTVVVQNPGGRHDDKFIATAHEYCFYYSKNSFIAKSNLLPLEEANIDTFKLQDEFGMFRTRDFRRSGNNSTRELRPLMYYPILVKNNEIQSITDEEFGRIFDKRTNTFDDGYITELRKKYTLTGFEMLLPIDPSDVKRVWRWGLSSLRNKISELVCQIGKDGKPQIKVKDRLDNKEGLKPKSVWNKPKYAGANGTGLIKGLFGLDGLFNYPKSLATVEDSLRITTNFDSIALDYFAGSGTTGHAVISLNRQDNGKRKYILVEQGEYFDAVTKPRIQKVVYSADWKEGKAIAPNTGISHAFKVLKIEGYEDTLNNLQLRRTEAQQSLLDTLPQNAKEDYLLRYLLDIESRGSLLSVKQFKQPFDCKLKVAVDSAGAYEERTIDLVETFNYLIGLRVKHIDMHRDKGFVSVTGWLPTGEKTLVLWRDVAQVDYETLNRLCDKLAINPADSEFEIVYINGDHNIPAVFTSTEAEGGLTKTLKIRQIEPEFLSRMFAVEDV
jgi:adenine-specific DNA-methyltransferase